MATDMELALLYWQLREQLLTRFFAYGRYFRTNYPSACNYLGVVRAPGSTTTGTADDPAVDGASELVTRPPLYQSATTLLGLTEPSQTDERWRIAAHRRDNPLMLSGQLLTCLSIEYHLGRKDESLPIIREALYALRQLYKFPNDQDNRSIFSGYILRWDAVTSDYWRTQNGQPTVCSNFVVGAGNRYLYSLPYDHPAYEPRTPGVNKSLTHGAWYRRFRWYEPSYDELVGLVCGYDIVFRLVDDPAIREIVREQVAMLGTYLSGCGYFLVRPSDGFTGQGAAGAGLMFEHPFGLVFKRITGSAYESRAGFPEIWQLARVWDSLRPALAPYDGLGKSAAWLVGAAAGLVPGASAPIAGLIAGLALLIAITGASALGALGALVALIPGAGPAILGAAQTLSSLLPPLGGAVGALAPPVSTLAGSVSGVMLKALTALATNSPDAPDVSYLLSQSLAQPQFPYVLSLTAGLFLNQSQFDVLNDEMASEIALGYALKELFDAPTRFEAGIRGLSLSFATGYAVGFPPYLGLTALNAAPGSAESGIAGLYRYWMNRRVALTDPSEAGFSQRGFAQGVALVLGDDTRAAPVTAYLNARFNAFTGVGQMSPPPANLTLTDDLPFAEFPAFSNITAEIVAGVHPKAPQNEALEYMVTLALSWLAAKQAADAGQPMTTPSFPFANTPLPSPSLPGSVFDHSANNPDPVTVPVFDGQTLTRGPLFPATQTGNASRPPDPPPQVPAIVSTDVHVATVSESDRDIDTGIGLRAFDQVSFSASGTIWAGVPLSGRNGPDGWSDVTTDSGYPLHSGPNAHRYALLFRLADPLNLSAPTRYFFLGKGTDPSVSPYIHQGDEKRILLRINDNQPGNGNGQFTVTLTVGRAA
jgi:hypothetical protein